ncbi:hypothetical protein V1264_023048 [Littorina saxatilis]|uniref:Bromo domain-containing protein n=1 Tax=Littorina saxatilis TaxID=31220 RepID=A0AAN9GA20_9CAEN
MVHTRHSGDVEVDSPPRFLSLEDKRSRKSRPLVSDVDEHDSDHSGIVYKDNNHSIFEEKLVESRLRPRTGPGAYNYVYGDSSEDDLMSRHRRARMLKESPFKVSRRDGRRAVMRGEPEPSSDEEEEPSRGRWRSAKTISVPKIRSREQPQDPHDDTRQDEPDGELEEDEEGDEEDDEDDDANNSALRRSSRLRKRPYRFRGTNKDLNKDGATTASLEREKRRRSDPNNSNEEFDDMYSRVKRPRTRKSDRGRRSASHSDGTNDDEKIDSADGTQQERRSYSLREHKPRTQLYIAPAIEAIKKKPKQPSLFRETPPRRIHKKAGSYRSPAHRRAHFRKRHAFHGSSSSTSSDPSDSGTETSDEQRFSRRKAKSMNKARSRICPLNFTPDMVSSSAVLKDRVRTGASLADVDPMEIDKSVRFDSVGGLQKHITALKEMVVFPLLYPEFYERFKVAPSRGVLFYGPPGTGKTLVARALANECSQGTQKVAFFMRKGADCLSKWVGEAERQLRLLFDKAYEMRPSIIFFDEIDGLAPVRSSRQDQIHSSIVSTLLALMDGIDSRGEIVVIGATNRVDAIDPALRRPGRFDREFHFPLPNLEDRERIFKIHTKNWNPPLRDDFIAEMAEKCSGYCGADIKSLVTEATHNALRRHYPQIYTTSDKLQLDISSITLTARDFAQGMTNIVPASQRAVPNPALALEASVRPLLSRALTKLQDALCGRFPFAKLERQQGGSGEGTAMLDIDLPSDEEENMPSIFLPGVRGNRSFTNLAPSPASFLQFSSGSSSFPVVFRPRMLVSGAQGQGQSVHLAPAALHLMEHLPVHALCSATLFAASAKMPEEACSNVFHEAKRTAPSIIFMPYINELWGVISDSLRVTFMTLIRGMSPSTPILLLATSEGLYSDLDDQLKMLFSFSGGEVVEVDGPNKEERCQFFSDLILHQTVRPPPTHKQAARRVLEPLAKAADPEPRKLTDREQRKLRAQEEDTLRELRIFLRDILSKLGREKKLSIFTKPVDTEEVPDYTEIIKNPMDLSTMMANIDLHKYNTASAFLDDIFLICSNALEYNPDHGPTDRAIRHRACALRDMAQALLRDELDPEFERLCQEITESRKRRGVDSSQTAPAFYRTRPLGAGFGAGEEPADQPIPEGCRYSRRVRGLEADQTLPLEAVEKTTQVEKTLLKVNKESPEKEGESEDIQGQAALPTEDGQKSDTAEQSLDDSMEMAEAKDVVADISDCKCPSSSTKGPSPVHSGKTSKGSSDSKLSSAAKRASIRKKCPWLATRRRRRFQSTPSNRAYLSPSQSHDRNSQSDGEQDWGDESMDRGHSPTAKPNDVWETGHRSHREYSPVSAANPANVSVAISTRTRSSLDTIPAIQDSSSADCSKPKAAATNSPAGAEDATKPVKAVAARSLDVDLMVVAIDSGLGSESNGDSRDSLDHNNSSSNRAAAQVDGENRVAGEEETGASTSTAGGPSFARTRARTQNPLQLRALAALEEESRVVRVDKERLSRLLETVVERTQGFNVEKLQHMYSILSCSIYSHRRHADKTQLLQEMEDTVQTFC